jgi:hypothetical protein
MELLLAFAFGVFAGAGCFALGYSCRIGDGRRALVAKILDSPIHPTWQSSTTESPIGFAPDRDVTPADVP